MNREQKTKKQCEALMKFKKDGVQLGSYMGTRWFITKGIGVIAVVVIILLFRQDEACRIVGAVLGGYVFGVVVADVRSYIPRRASWVIQKEFIDWVKVEEHLKSDE
jgi:hypothetical protein